MHLDRRLTWAKHIKTKRKSTQPKSETNVLVTRKINTIDRKPTPIQSSTQTHMDLRNSAMGDSLQFQHQNTPVLSIQDCLIHSERTLVHKTNHGIHEDLQMNAVLSEIKMWNIKYLTLSGPAL
jgi:hypothetical protein